MLIKYAEVQHAEMLLRYHRENALRFKRWSPLPPPDYFTLSYWQHRLEVRERQHAERSAVSFIGLDDDETRIIGTCSLTGIVYEPGMCCVIGYSVDGNHEGKGDMTRICRCAIDHAFQDLRLNRIVASYMPDNVRSGQLLAKLGFEKEGYSRRLLKINGVWTDHITAALLNPDPP